MTGGSRLQLSDWPAGLAWSASSAPSTELELWEISSFPAAALCSSCSSTGTSVVVWKLWGRGQVFLPQKGPRPPLHFPEPPLFYEACVPVWACKRRPIPQTASTRGL